jgi:hypothetical protein
LHVPQARDVIMYKAIDKRNVPFAQENRAEA